nr:putative DNA binding domain-containing protein [bacterium]
MRENKHLEFKQEINDKFLKTVSAFANYDGGDIIFGIADDGEKTGLKNIDQQCLIIENKINDSLEPKPDFTLSVNEKDKTITLHVNRGSHPPYLYKNKAYKRNSTSTVETDIIETKRLILDGERLNLEELKSNNQHLSFTYLEKEFQEVLGIKALNEDVLKTLNLFSDTDGYNIAALILSDQNSFPGIDIARFGENINIILHRVTFENCSLLKMFNEAINIFEQYYAYEEIKGSRREKIYTIPLEAFREALANAIVHRMWDINAYVRVAMFANKIEIYSPGGLPRDISEDEYLNG